MQWLFRINRYKQHVKYDRTDQLFTPERQKLSLFCGNLLEYNERTNAFSLVPWHNNRLYGYTSRTHSTMPAFSRVLRVGPILMTLQLSIVGRSPYSLASCTFDHIHCMDLNIRWWGEWLRYLKQSSIKHGRLWVVFHLQVSIFSHRLICTSLAFKLRSVCIRRREIEVVPPTWSPLQFELTSNAYLSTVTSYVSFNLALLHTFATWTVCGVQIARVFNKNITSTTTCDYFVFC